MRSGSGARRANPAAPRSGFRAAESSCPGFVAPCGRQPRSWESLGKGRAGRGLGRGERGGRIAGRGGAGLGPAPGWELSRARRGEQCQDTGGEAALQSPTRCSSRELARQPELGGKLAPECWGLKGGSERWLWGEQFGDYDV